MDLDNKEDNIKNFLILVKPYIENTSPSQTLTVGEVLKTLKEGFEKYPEITPEYTFGWLEKINTLLALFEGNTKHMSLKDLVALFPSSYSTEWFRDTAASISGDLSF